MRIVVAENAGFCPGVNLAIEKVIELASKNKKKIFTLGQIIHNNNVIQELEKRGIKAIDDIEEIDDPQNSILLIRAHGIPPELENKIKEKNIEYIDATCPLVKNVHRIIKLYREKGYRTLIFGDKNHAEVIGLIGYAGSDCIVISSIKEAETLPPLEKINLVSQTTQEEDIFLKVAEVLSKKAKELIISNTICEPTKNRQKETKIFAANSDLVIVVGGKHSANTKRLYDICNNLSKKAVLVENESEITRDLFTNVESIFITAGASTPKWMVERVARKVKNLTTEKNKISQFVEFIISSGLSGLFSFASILIISSKLLKIRLGVSEIISSATALTFAHLINRFTNIKEDALRKTLLLEYSKTTSLFLIILPITSIFFSFKNILFMMMIVSFNIAAIFYQKIHKQKFISISKDTAIIAGWLYIFVIVPTIVSKLPTSINFIVTSIFILSLSIIRNNILKILYIHSDIIPEEKSRKARSTTSLMYISSMIISFIPFFFISYEIGIYLLIVSVCYLIFYNKVISKKIPLTAMNELCIDIPFVILLGYFIIS